MPDTFAPVEVGLHHITKRFADQTAVDGVTLRIHEGEFFSVSAPPAAARPRCCA